MFLSLFGSFSQLALPPSIVALQDPPVYRGKLPSFNLFTLFSPPTDRGCKAPVAFYVYRSFVDSVSLLPRFFGRGDVMALDLFTPGGFFNPSTTGFTIVNSYSTKGRLNNTRSVPPDIVFPVSPLPTLTLGDLNIHHPTADPLRVFKEDEIATSAPYFDRATELGFTLLNVPGVFTRLSMSLIGRPGVIDLACACPLLAAYFTEWTDPLSSTGSDHIPILLRFEAAHFRAPPPTPYWALTDWPTLESTLKATCISPAPPIATTHSMDIWFKTNLDRITAELALHTPVKRVTFQLKPWWFDLLSQLRRAYNSALRTSKVDRFDAALLASTTAARTAYFKAIKKVKRDHWSAFLANATPQSVWTAKKFAVGRPPPHFPELPGATTPPELNKALLNHFFPGDPVESFNSVLLPFRHCPALAADEISRALARSSPSSAPGPDMAPNSVWKRLHRVAPAPNSGPPRPVGGLWFPPASPQHVGRYCARQTGQALLRLPLLLPHYRVATNIFQNPGEAHELKTLVRGPHRGPPRPPPMRLAGRPVDLRCNHHTHYEVRTLQMAVRKVSTLFLDVKGGFDNVNPSTLCTMLREQAVNPYLVSWTRSFLTGRTCRLRYQGSPRVFAPVTVGTPQGSPVLFVIFVSRLHCGIPQGLTLSYVDDFGLTVSSTSYRRNIQSLQRHYAVLKARGARLGVGFSVPKTELIHRRTNRNRGPVSRFPIHLDGSIFPPKD